MYRHSDERGWGEPPILPTQKKQVTLRALCIFGLIGFLIVTFWAVGAWWVLSYWDPEFARRMGWFIEAMGILVGIQFILMAIVDE